MILKLFGKTALLVGVVLSATAAPAPDSPSDAVLGAYDAYRAGDALKLARYSKRLEGDLLEPWADYWSLAVRLEDASEAEVQGFFAEHGSTYVGELLRGDWLKVLGRRRDWKTFEREAAGFPRPDLEIQCYQWSARIARGDDSAKEEAAPVWLEPRELPEGCAALAETLMKLQPFSLTQIWQRVRVLFENGQITAAKTALGYLPRRESPDERALAEAARAPKRLLARLPASLEQRPVREVAVLAGIRLARADPAAAARALEGSFGERLPERELMYLWGRVGVEAARIHLDKALKWYARAGDARLDDDQLAWKVRAALRREKWAVVRSSIDRMSGAARLDPAWIYWYGRGLAAQGDEAGSRAYFLRIAGQTDFYGLLADEELGYVGTAPEGRYVPTEEEVARAAAEPGLARALELIRLGVRTEGVREWLYTLRSMDDHSLLAAAELARREEVYDREIQAADRTERIHNFALRYPMPYRDVFEEYAKTHGLDEAWVFGLVRQESRFVAEARSAAGAAGLMQVMPGTARYVASNMRMRDVRAKRVAELQTNVRLGTGYMKIVLGQLGHSVLASAAYNAGPSRAKRWRDARPLEGAIYVETIPFPETRDYVKKVTANSVFYSALIDGKAKPIKERLGIVPARDSAEPADEEDALE